MDKTFCALATSPLMQNYFSEKVEFKDCLNFCNNFSKLPTQTERFKPIKPIAYSGGSRIFLGPSENS